MQDRTVWFPSKLSSIWEHNNEFQGRELFTVSEIFKENETNRIQMSKQVKEKIWNELNQAPQYYLIAIGTDNILSAFHRHENIAFLLMTLQSELPLWGPKVVVRGLWVPYNKLLMRYFTDCALRKTNTVVGKLKMENKSLHCLQHGIHLVLFPMGKRGWI